MEPWTFPVDQSALGAEVLAALMAHVEGLAECWISFYFFLL